MTVTIKQKLHNLIDKIDNDLILNHLYNILQGAKMEGNLWKQLNTDQQNQLLLSLEESKNPENLISNAEVKSNLNKWL